MSCKKHAHIHKSVMLGMSEDLEAIEVNGRTSWKWLLTALNNATTHTAIFKFICNTHDQVYGLRFIFVLTVLRYLLGIQNRLGAYVNKTLEFGFWNRAKRIRSLEKALRPKGYSTQLRASWARFHTLGTWFFLTKGATPNQEN